MTRRQSLLAEIKIDVGTIGAEMTFRLGGTTPHRYGETTPRRGGTTATVGMTGAGMTDEIVTRRDSWMTVSGTAETDIQTVTGGTSVTGGIETMMLDRPGATVTGGTSVTGGIETMMLNRPGTTVTGGDEMTILRRVRTIVMGDGVEMKIRLRGGMIVTDGVMMKLMKQLKRGSNANLESL